MTNFYKKFLIIIVLMMHYIVGDKLDNSINEKVKIKLIVFLALFKKACETFNAKSAVKFSGWKLICGILLIP